VQSVETAKPRLDPMLEAMPYEMAVQDNSSYAGTCDGSVRQSAQGASNLKNASLV
jgi:hypothetical protein